jgi:FKBP-type peptidyl-prolyl cis-trans isomerase
LKKILLVAAALGPLSCGGGDADALGNQVTATATAPGVDLASMIQTPTGLHYRDLAVGDGDEAVAGQTVTVHYAGWLLDGDKFDASVDRGEPYSFLLGARRVIAGWDEGVAGMRVGGLRRLVIPSELGYGPGGRPPIPPNATLVFDVELLGVGR